MENHSSKISKETKTTTFGRGTFTVEEEKDIENALRKRLGPSFISQRPAGGGKYIFDILWLNYKFSVHIIVFHLKNCLRIYTCKYF